MVQDTSNSLENVVSPETCQRVAQRQAENRERFWKIAQEIGARNADKDPDEVMRVVTEVVEEVRQERYEREQCAKRRRWRQAPSLAPSAVVGAKHLCQRPDQTVVRSAIR